MRPRARGCRAGVATLSVSLSLALALALAWPAPARAVRRDPAPPDSAILARLQQDTLVRVARLEPAADARCDTAPGGDSCMAGHRVSLWAAPPDTAWTRQLMVLLSTPATYERAGAPDRYNFVPEIGVQFRGPAGATDVALCYVCARLNIASAPAPATAPDHQFRGRFATAIVPLIRLAKQAFPRDAFIQSWPESATADSTGAGSLAPGLSQVPGADSAALRKAPGAGRPDSAAARADSTAPKPAPPAAAARVPRRRGPPAPHPPVLVWGQPSVPSGTQVERDVEPALVKAVPPAYPDALRGTPITFNVFLNVLVSEAGAVSAVEIAQGIPPLDSAAVAAARQYVFKPATAKGKPVAVWVPVTVAFTPR